MFEQFLDPVLKPLLGLPPILMVLIVSFGVTIFTTLVYWLVTDQKKMKSHKKRMKEINKEMKNNKHDISKVQELQNELLKINGEYMKHSFKPTIITLIPLLILFGWMNMNLTYDPIMAGDNFTTTVDFVKGSYGNITIDVPEQITLYGEKTRQVGNEVSWLMSANESGEYDLVYTYGKETYYQEIIVGEPMNKPTQTMKDSAITQISFDNKKLVVLNLGFWTMGWLSIYIISSVLLSMGLRKLLKID